jgi:hypothetical protein
MTFFPGNVGGFSVQRKQPSLVARVVMLVIFAAMVVLIIALVPVVLAVVVVVLVFKLVWACVSLVVLGPLMAMGLIGRPRGQGSAIGAGGVGGSKVVGGMDEDGRSNVRVRQSDGSA